MGVVVFVIVLVLTLVSVVVFHAVFVCVFVSVWVVVLVGMIGRFRFVVGSVFSAAIVIIEPRMSPRSTCPAFILVSCA